MSKLDIIRSLAAQAKRINPAELSKPQAGEYTSLARKVYTPQFRDAERRAQKWLEMAQKAGTPEQHAKYLEAYKKTEYEKARYAKLDQAASNIGKARTIYDDDLRAFTVPGNTQGVPGGIATFYPPGHYLNDPVMGNASYLELLGTSPDVAGAGRVLLRKTGLDSPSNPMFWHSTSYPETMGFYESRGAERIDPNLIPKNSDLSGSLPVFGVKRGDAIKEKNGGHITKNMASGGSTGSPLSWYTQLGSSPTITQSSQVIAPSTVSGLQAYSADAYGQGAASAAEGLGGLGSAAASNSGQTSGTSIGQDASAAFGQSAFGLGPMAHAFASVAVPGYTMVNAMTNLATMAPVTDAVPVSVDAINAVSQDDAPSDMGFGFGVAGDSASGDASAEGSSAGDAAGAGDGADGASGGEAGGGDAGGDGSAAGDAAGSGDAGASGDGGDGWAKGGRVKQLSATRDYERYLELQRQKASPLYPSRENAKWLDPQAEDRDMLFIRAILREQPEQEMTATPLRASTVARAALSGAGSFGGWTDEERHEPAPEATARFLGQVVSDPLNAVGLGALKMVGRGIKKALPAAAALGTTAYAGDAEAMPFHSYMKFLKNARGDIGHTPLFVNPDSSDLKELWKSAREDSFTNDITPTLRIMRDRKTPDTAYGWDGTKLLHKDVADYLGKPLSNFQGQTIEGNQDAAAMLRWLRERPQEFAGGGSVAGAAKRMAQRAMSQADDMRPSSVAPRGALSVVKPKGGNWLNDSVESALDQLSRFNTGQMAGLSVKQYREAAKELGLELDFKDSYTPTFMKIEKHALQKAHPETGLLRGWVEGPLTKYIKNRMGSPDDEIRLMADKKSKELWDEGTRGPAEIATMTGRLEKMRKEGSTKGLPPDEWQAVLDRTQRNIDTRAAELEQQYNNNRDYMLHMSNIGDGMEMMGRRARFNAGMPMDNTAQFPAAEMWENATDYSMRSHRPSEYIKPQGEPYRTEALKARIKDSLPWLEKVDPKTRVYDFKSNNVNELGFNHIVDELRNALDPTAGLPTHLQLSQDAVKNLSMEKAVQRVADINRWRAAQAIETNLKFGLAPKLVREYAENNPKGLTWRELDLSDPADISSVVDVIETSPGQWKNRLKETDRHGSIRESPPFDSYEEALEAAKEKARIAHLEKQLRYEGDTMQHCVGGYCPDVVDGRSRIFSLRDNRGEPHVTIEVNPKKEWLAGEDLNNVRPGLFDEYLAQRNTMDGQNSLREFMEARYPAELSKLETPRIKQIKGKHNSAPGAAYLPFIQDFVRNPPHGQPWDDVADLSHAGLIDVAKPPPPSRLGRIWPQEAFDRARQAKGRYVTGEELQTFEFPPEIPPEGFARGGTVRTYPKPTESPDTIGTRGFSDLRAIMDALKEHHANA